MSAATAHVMASIENLACSLPAGLRALARRGVDAAPRRAVRAFFRACCVAGAATEAAVPLLMYCGRPRAAIAAMGAMHTLFSVTVPPFSVAVSAFVPFFALGMAPGAAGRCLGPILGRPQALLLLGGLLALMLRRGGAPLDKMRHVRWICQVRARRPGRPGRAFPSPAGA